MTEEYLRTKIIGIIQPMVNSLLIEMPANPEFFMLKWLQTYNLVENIRINKEREEFESLRSELNFYLRKEKEEAEKGKKKKNNEEHNTIMIQNENEEKRVDLLQMDDDGIALGKVSLSNFHKNNQQ